MQYNWPQYAMIVVFILTAIGASTKFAEDKILSDFWISLGIAALQVFLLKAGNFF